MIEPVEKIAMKTAIFCKKKLQKRKKKRNITKNVFHFNCSFSRSWSPELFVLQQQRIHQQQQQLQRADGISHFWLYEKYGKVFVVQKLWFRRRNIRSMIIYYITLIPICTIFNHIINMYAELSSFQN